MFITKRSRRECETKKKRKPAAHDVLDRLYSTSVSVEVIENIVDDRLPQFLPLRAVRWCCIIIGATASFFIYVTILKCLNIRWKSNPQSYPHIPRTHDHTHCICNIPYYVLLLYRKAEKRHLFVILYCLLCRRLNLQSVGGCCRVSLSQSIFKLSNVTLNK